MRLSFPLDNGRLTAAAGLGRGNTVARDITLAEMMIAADARPRGTCRSDLSVMFLFESRRAA